MYMYMYGIFGALHLNVCIYVYTSDKVEPFNSV